MTSSDPLRDDSAEAAANVASDAAADDTIEVSFDDTVPVGRGSVATRRGAAIAAPGSDAGAGAATRSSAQQGAAPSVHPSIPVVYGARDPHAAAAAGASDSTVHGQLGPGVPSAPPPATSVPVKPARTELVATIQRDARRRTITLAAYGVVVLIAVVGLWVISQALL